MPQSFAYNPRLCFLLLDANLPPDTSMRSDKQIQASKTKSANSTRHGLLAETVVLHGESAKRFQKLLAFMQEHQPRTATQASLVETMAATRWRQSRVWQAKKIVLNRAMLNCVMEGRWRVRTTPARTSSRTPLAKTQPGNVPLCRRTP